MRKLVHPLWGKRFGDRGYRSQELFEQLWRPGLSLLTRLKRNRKNRLMPGMDKLLLPPRAIMACVNEQLKNSSPVEPTRHRRATHGIVHRGAAVGAYTFQPQKPALALLTTSRSEEEQQFLTAAII